MKNVLVLFAIFAFISIGCGDDDTMVTDYNVDIKINNPTANSSFQPFDKIPLSVTYTRGTDEIIHHVKVEILDASGTVVKTLLEEHAHIPGMYEYNDDIGFTIDNVGTYTLKASSHDMEGNYAEPAEITLSAQ